MSLLNDASLVLIPSGYKEDKVYSIIPSDGSGDLDFVRGSDGTRINSLGQVENVCWNLLQNSNNLNQYGSTNATKTNNTTTSPIGTSDAGSMFETSATSYDHYLYNIGFGSKNGAFTYSVYLKQNGRRYVQLATVTGQGVYRPIFDLQDGVYVSNAGNNTGATASIENAGNGWYRCIVTHPSGTTSLDQITIILQNSATYQSYAGDTSKGVFVWGAQLNTGALKPYFPTTDRLNVPRLTYENGCPSLLLEKQSTNLQLYSQEFSNWILGGATVTSNNVISPDGTQNADTINFSSGGAVEQLIFYAADNLTHTVSVYAKVPSGTSTFRLKITQAGVANHYSPYFTATTTWQRFTFTQTFGSGGIGFYSGVESNSSALNLWGFQLEPNSAYPTSYIPTTSTSVTRLADSCYKTGISSLIGQTEGTIFVDWVQNAFSNSQGIYANNYNLTGSISIQISTNGTIQAFVCYANTYFSIVSSANAIQVGQRYKVGFVYKSGDCALYLNGNLISTSNITFAFTTSLSEIDLSNRTVFFANLSEISVNQMLQFKTRITNTELAQLTTI